MSRSATIAQALRAKLRGAVCDAGDRGYDQDRRVWNGAIDRRPCAIARCADARDVRRALRVARDHGIPVTVRGGGHNVAGLSVQDGALLLDLAGMRAVIVDEQRQLAIVEGGACWSDVDSATAAVGLATTGGLISTTGVGGFTLGGGAGWLMRRYGLACDNLLGAHVVLADGSSVRADAGEHADLFWGLRGGAGGLGVVTHFEFRLYPMQQVLAGLVVFPGDEVAAVLKGFRGLVRNVPDEFCGMAVISSAPPLPFLDAAWHGRTVCIIAACWSGEVAAGVPVLDSFRQLGNPLGSMIAPMMPYAQWQQLLDAGAPPGRHQYWKTNNFADLCDGTIELLAVAGHARPTPFTELHVQHMGGAVARVADSDSAFVHRDAQFFVNLLGAAADGTQFDATRRWIRDLHSRLSANALPGRLPNFCDGDDQDPIARFGSDHARRLQDLRGRYDPDELFAGTRHGSAGRGSRP